MMYAIIETGGKQIKVAQGDSIFVEKLEGAAGEEVTFDKVLLIGGENLIVGPDLAIGANRGLVNSPGHYTQMINKNHAYAGYGCVKVNGDTYWVQIFSNANKYYEDGYKDNPVVWDQLPVGTRKDYTADFTISIKPEYVALKANNSVILEEGDTHKVTAGVSYTNKKGSWTTFVPLKANQYTVKVLTPNLCTYENGVMTALKEGTAQLQITLNADTSKTVTLSMKIEGKPVENGSTFSIGTTDYKITSTDSKTVEYRVGNTSSSTITIPNTVTIKGKSYKVTSISSNAFKNNTNLTNVTIGKNVKKIGKNAFYGCKNLKKITVKSTKISSVGSNAFKNIHKKAVIKVPKSKLSKYKKLFKNKGQKKSVKITK